MNREEIDQAKSISNLISIVLKELRRDGTLSSKDAKEIYEKMKNHIWEHKGKYLSLLAVLISIDFVPQFNEWLSKSLFQEVLINVATDAKILTFFKDTTLIPETETKEKARREKGDDVAQGTLPMSSKYKMDGTPKNREQVKYDKDGLPDMVNMSLELQEDILEVLNETIKDEDLMDKEDLIDYNSDSGASNTGYDEQQDGLMMEKMRMFEQGEIDRDGKIIDNEEGEGLEKLKEHFKRNTGKYVGALATMGAVGLNKLVGSLALQKNDLINQQAYSHFTHRGYGLKEHFKKHKKKYIASSAFLYAMNKEAMDYAMINPLSLNNYGKGEGLKEHFKKHKAKYAVGSAFLGKISYDMLNREDPSNVLSIQDIAKDLELGDNWIQLGKDLKNNQDGEGLREHFKKHKAKYLAGIGGLGAVGFSHLLRNRVENYYTPPNTPYEVEEYPVPVPSREDRLLTKHMRILRNSDPEKLSLTDELSVRHIHHLLGGKGLWGDLWGGVKPYIHQAIKYFVPTFNPPDAQGHRYLID
tara:strand:- start:697 stop:2277 length:1581 start_codon:yes stop_codon:yes gene_type:complete